MFREGLIDPLLNSSRTLALRGNLSIWNHLNILVSCCILLS
jgi:hypothetical protein